MFFSYSVDRNGLGSFVSIADKLVFTGLLYSMFVFLLSCLHVYVFYSIPNCILALSGQRNNGPNQLDIL